MVQVEASIESALLSGLKINVEQWPYEQKFDLKFKLYKLNKDLEKLIFISTNLKSKPIHWKFTWQTGETVDS